MNRAEGFYRSLCTPIIISLFSFANLCQAAPLRIVDHLGLLRAVREVEVSAEIKMTVSESDKDLQEIRLSHVDGLSEDIMGSSAGPNTYIFHGVSYGTWAVLVKPDTYEILAVNILSSPENSPEKQ